MVVLKLAALLRILALYSPFMSCNSNVNTCPNLLTNRLLQHAHISTVQHFTSSFQSCYPLFGHPTPSLSLLHQAHCLHLYSVHNSSLLVPRNFEELRSHKHVTKTHHGSDDDRMIPSWRVSIFIYLVYKAVPTGLLAVTPSTLSVILLHRRCAGISQVLITF